MIGQALVAACRTVDVASRPPHSLHAYFLLGGDPKVPIIYDVERIRDGKSFTTRRVVAIQHGAGDLHHVGVVPRRRARHVASGEDAGRAHAGRPAERRRDLKEQVLPLMPEPVRRYYERERPIELRPVEFDRYLGKKIEDGRFHVWIRATGQLPDDPAIHQCVLAYASDMTLLDSALMPHGRTRVREDHHGGEPRPRALVSPPVPRRRLAALRAGQSEPGGRARLFARPDLRARRHAGGVGGAGGRSAAASGRASGQR